MTYTPQFISTYNTTRCNFFYQNSTQHVFEDAEEKSATNTLRFRDIKDLTKDQLLSILYIDGDPQKGKKHVYPFILLRNDCKDIPYPMELIAQKRNDLFSIYKEYVNGFLDDINKQMKKSGLPPITSIEELLYDQDQNNLCHMAAKVNNFAAIDFLPDWMAIEFNSNKEHPIYVAASYGSTEAAVKLFKKQKQPLKTSLYNNDRITPARVAVQKGHIDTALALIKEGDQVFLPYDRNPNIPKNEELKEWLVSLYPNDEDVVKNTLQNLLFAQEKRMRMILHLHRNYLRQIGIKPLEIPSELLQRKTFTSEVTMATNKNPQTPPVEQVTENKTPVREQPISPQVSSAAPVEAPSVEEKEVPQQPAEQPAVKTVISSEQQISEPENPSEEVELKTKKVVIEELRQNLAKRKKKRAFFDTLTACEEAGITPQVNKEYVLKQQEELDELNRIILEQRVLLKINAAFETAVVRIMCGDFTREQLTELNNLVQARINS